MNGHFFKFTQNASFWIKNVRKIIELGIKQKREQPKLFTRNRTKGKRFTDGIIAQQNRERGMRRVRGNSSFSHRKH